MTRDTWELIDLKGNISVILLYLLFKNPLIPFKPLTDHREQRTLCIVRTFYALCELNAVHGTIFFLGKGKYFMSNAVFKTSNVNIYILPLLESKY